MKRAMLAQVVRRSLPELVIGLAVCGGVLGLVAAPLDQKLAAQLAETAKLEAAVSRADQDAKSQPGSRPSSALINAAASPPANRATDPAAAKTALDAIAFRSAPAAERKAMFDAIMRLGDAHNVRINQFQPASLRPRAARPGSPGEQAAMITNTPRIPSNSATPTASASGGASVPNQPPTFETRVAYSISFEGLFPDAVGFVRALQSDLGFTNLRSIRVNPLGDSPRVSIVVETEHLAFDAQRFVLAQIAAMGTTQTQGANP